MTVEDTSNKIQYTGDGVFTGPYPFTFQTLEEWIDVYVAGVIVSNTTYTLTVNADQDASPGGDVVFDTAVADTLSIVILRTAPITQESEYTPFDPFPSERVEGDFDKGTIIDQQLQEVLDRSLVLAVDSTQDTVLPPAIASGYWRWNSDASAVEYAGVPGVVIPSEVVGNVTDMVTDSSLEIGDYVITTGYYAAGDGGDNTYTIVPALTGTVDAGSFIDLSNGLQAQGIFPQDLHSVLQWGAVRDDATLTFDNTSAFQAAIDYLYSLIIPAGLGSSSRGVGGVLHIPIGNYPLVSISVWPGVTLKGSNLTESIITQLEGSVSHMINCPPRDGVTTASQSAPATIEKVQLFGNSVGAFKSTVTNVTSASAVVNVADSSIMFEGMLVDAPGFAYGTTLLSIDNLTQITLSATSGMTYASDSGLFRDNYIRTIAGTSGDFTFTVDSNTDLQVGMRVESSITTTDCYITDISGLTITVDVPLNGTSGGTSADISVFNCSIFCQKASIAPGFDPVRTYRAPILRDLAIIRSGGDCIYVGPLRDQWLIEDVQCIFGRASGVVVNSASDGIGEGLLSGAHVRDGLRVGTSATPRFLRSEFFVGDNPDKSYEVVSNGNIGFQLISAEINGAAKITPNSNITWSGVRFVNVNFIYNANQALADGTAQPGLCIIDDCEGVSLENCYFLGNATLVPDFIVAFIGSGGSCNLIGGNQSVAGDERAYAVALTNVPDRLSYMYWDPSINDRTMRISRLKIDGDGTGTIALSLNRGQSIGVLSEYKFSDTIVANMLVDTDRMSLRAVNATKGIAIDVPGPYADDAAAATDGILVGQSYFLAVGDVVVRLV